MVLELKAPYGAGFDVLLLLVPSSAETSWPSW
jgi:hypothetical protein